MVSRVRDLSVSPATTVEAFVSPVEASGLFCVSGSGLCPSGGNSYLG